MASSLQDLKSRIDIVALIGETVKLRKDGAAFKGLCPLHPDEKTPSLAVYPDTGRFKCYGCGKAGDALAWVMETQRVDFKTAKATLEARYGGHQLLSTLSKAAQPTETTYDIFDHAGELVAQHIRRDLPDGSKTFIWRRDGQDGLGGLKTDRLPLYGMVDLIAAEPGADIVLVEGEKSRDSLKARGRLALGTVCGANVVPHPEVFEPLLGSRVYLWPDNDPPGYAHMAGIARTLQKMGVEVRLIRWTEAPPKGDAADFTGDLDSLIAAAEHWPAETATPQLVSANEHIEQNVNLLTGNIITFRAENVRRERTGVHSRVTILLDGSPLAFDTFNIERDADRGRLARSAAERFPDGIDTLVNPSALKGYLDAFTASLWDNSVSQDMPRLVVPSEILPRLRFLLESYVLAGAGTILFAPPGAGKSYTTMLMAVSIDAGVSKLWPVNQARVLFVNLERSEESVRRRLWMCNKALGLPVTRPLLMLNRRGRTLAEISEAVKRCIRQEGVEVVFLDSISRSGAGDLIENQTANRTIDMLSALCPTWVALGHTPRADDTHAFGSVHFDAGADLMVQLTSQAKDGTLGIGLKVTKSNDTPKGPMQAYALQFVDSALIDARPARSHEFGELAMSQKMSPVQEIINYLLEVGEATATEIADALDRDRANVSRLLNGCEEFVKTRKVGKEQYWALQEHRQ